jgi:hypothetical protein
VIRLKAQEAGKAASEVDQEIEALTAMQERAQALGGQLDIQNTGSLRALAPAFSACCIAPSAHWYTQARQDARRWARATTGDMAEDDDAAIAYAGPGDSS